MIAPNSTREPWRRRILYALLALVVVVMALPSTSLASLRRFCPPLSRLLSWLEARSGSLDLDHVAFFALIGLLLGLLTPRAWRWRAALCLPLIAAATEVMQYGVPGRTPRISDARDDILGAAIGWIVALVVLWLIGRIAAVRRGPIESRAGQAESDASHKYKTRGNG